MKVVSLMNDPEFGITFHRRIPDVAMFEWSVRQGSLMLIAKDKTGVLVWVETEKFPAGTWESI